MRVLVVSPVPTHPPTEGNRVCVLSCATALKDLGHDVDLLYVYRPWVDGTQGPSETAEAWKGHFYAHAASFVDRMRQAIEYRFFFPAFRRHSFKGLCPRGLARAVNTLQSKNKYEAIIFNYWFLASVAEKIAKSRTLLFAHDMFADRWQRTGAKWLSTDAATETRALNSVNAVLAIQAAEGDAFAQRTKTPVFTCYSYFPTVQLPLGPVHNLLFLAGPNPANVDAITGFVNCVLPALRSQDERIHLVIGGGVCGPLAAVRFGAGVVLQPDIPNLADFYAQGSVCVNPVAGGSGLKIKLFEAMSFGRVVACHPHCLEGIYEPSRALAIVCATTEDYVRELIKRISSTEMVNAESRAGFQYVRDLNAYYCQALSIALTG